MTPVTFRTSHRNYRWLKLASKAGISMSEVINGLIDGPGQHSGLQGEIEWRLRDRIDQLREAGYVVQANDLESALDYIDHPECY